MDEINALAVTVNTPSLDELRSYHYLKRAKNNATGFTHGRKWEHTTVMHAGGCKGICGQFCVQNRQHTLRITNDFAERLASMKGPKGRRSSRVPGPTPDESYVQAGQRANGLPHQLRRRMCLFFAMSDDAILQLLELYPEGSMNHGKGERTAKMKKKAIGIVMPSLRRAMQELYSRLLKRNPELHHHPALKKRWAPAVCRLLELHFAHEHPK